MASGTTLSVIGIVQWNRASDYANLHKDIVVVQLTPFHGIVTGNQKETNSILLETTMFNFNPKPQP